jgi:hypothetical protein
VEDSSVDNASTISQRANRIFVCSEPLFERLLGKMGSGT